MKGTLNYKEYKCPCGGEIYRRKVSTEWRGFFNRRAIFTYYYECPFCGRNSEYYEADITDKVRGDTRGM